jgi:hypothetical protein
MTQTQTTVSATPPAAPPTTTQTTQTTQQAAVDATALERQIADLKAANGEKDRAIEFWQGKATAKPEPAAARTEAAEEDTDDILDVITSKGAKGLEQLLEKKGFVRKADVDATVNAKASELVKERELMETYPDLANKSSDFFKSTALHYGNLVKQGVSPAAAMEMAAERTELNFLREGKMKTPQQKQDEDKAEREKERRARAGAQAGDRGVRTPAASEEDEELTAEQKHIARSMGITEEAYKERAKKGVSMRGVR